MRRTDEITSPVAIVIPALNERESVGKVLDDVRSLDFPSIPIVVDGRSHDGTVEIARGKKAEVLFQKHIGYGDALQTGFLYALENHRAPIITMMDADGTYDVRDLPRLVQPILDGTADFAIGNRFYDMDKGAMTLSNKVGNMVISKLVSSLLGIPVADSQCGIRAFRSSLAKDFSNCSNGMPFATEMLATAARRGARIVEMPVRYHTRVGITKLNPLSDGAKILLKILSNTSRGRNRGRVRRLASHQGH
jgi:glycosyltransferase involved in cell wall biosynthesis